MDDDLEATAAELAPKLLAYAFGRTRDRALAEDLAQEALAALVARWRRAGRPDSPEAYVLAIARGRATRALVRRRLLLAFDGEAHGRQQRPAAEEQLEVRRTLAAIRRLPRVDREVLLAVAAGFEPAEAAEALGLRGSTFRMRLLRARRRLAEFLTGSTP